MLEALVSKTSVSTNSTNDAKTTRPAVAGVGVDGFVGTGT